MMVMMANLAYELLVIHYDKHPMDKQTSSQVWWRYEEKNWRLMNECLTEMAAHWLAGIGLPSNGLNRCVSLFLVFMRYETKIEASLCWFSLFGECETQGDDYRNHPRHNHNHIIC